MPDHEDIAQVFRSEYGRTVAVLTRVLGDISSAEDAVQDAFVTATRRWPTDGVPPSPPGWIITTARNSGLDRLRRDAVRANKHAEAELLRAERESVGEGPIHDDQLRLMFTCCHPSIAMPARVALTLRLLGGLTTAEIARAFLVPESTVAQRIVRAKNKIRRARIPYRIPADADLPLRLDGVLAVLYLIFNEGYLASSGSELMRTDLCAEAIRLTRVLVGLVPDSLEATGLLALMLLTHARRDARTTAAGELVVFGEQDRRVWDHALIDEARGLVRECLRRNRPGPYQIQAAIGAVHSEPTTDWRQVLALYDQLLAVAPNRVAALNRAVAIAEVEGPEAALAIVDTLDLEQFHLTHAVRADLLRTLRRRSDAIDSYDRAISLTTNDIERAFLQRRRAELE